MLGQFFQNKIEDASATARLREMVAVLRKRGSSPGDDTGEIADDS